MHSLRAINNTAMNRKKSAVITSGKYEKIHNNGIYLENDVLINKRLHEKEKYVVKR